MVGFEPAIGKIGFQMTPWFGWQNGTRLIIRVLAVALVLFGSAVSSFAVDTYIQMEVDSNGELHILTKRHQEVVLKKQADQVGFEKVAIAPDGRSVGWLALYPDCCGSDPVPMKLVIYSQEKLRTFTGSGLPIWSWCFEAEGRQVAFEQEMSHGQTGAHYELRDIETGELVAHYDPDPDAEMTARPPRWVAEVDSKR
jgi:hypothetical protein